MVIKLTTRDRVKRRGSIQGAQLDEFLDELILEVSQDAQEYLARHIWTTARTEVYELQAHNHTLSVKGAPIQTVTSVKYASTRDFSAVSALSAAQYEVDEEGGTIYFRYDTPFSPGFVQVVYDGGMVTASSEEAATDSFVAQYPVLAAAVDKQVIEEHRRKGVQTGTVLHRGSQVQQNRQLGLLDDVRRRLDFHRRRGWGK